MFKPLRVQKRHLPTLQLTERDQAIVEAVYCYRMLTRAQVERLFFLPNVNDTRAKIRLQRLHQHGFLRRLHQPRYPNRPNPSAVYRLATAGARWVAQKQGIPLGELKYWGKGDDRDHHATQVSASFLHHNLTLVDLRLAIEQAMGQAGLTLEAWQDEAELRHDKEHPVVFADIRTNNRARIPIIPDGYFGLLSPHGKGHFFLEADMGTESVSDKWRRKIVGYKAYFTGGLFHQKYSVPDRTTGFRVLVATSSSARAAHLHAAFERYGPPELARLFLVAPTAEVLSTPIAAPIWLRGGHTGAQILL